jgi:hypothetical protein
MEEKELWIFLLLDILFRKRHIIIMRSRIRISFPSASLSLKKGEAVSAYFLDLE